MGPPRRCCALKLVALKLNIKDEICKLCSACEKKKKNEGVHSGREAKADTDGSSEPASKVH